MRRVSIGVMSIVMMLGVLFINSAQATRLNQEDGIMQNHSADYVRTLNRSASTDVDAAFYNPAGLAFLDVQGLHIQFSSQVFHVQRLHSMDYYGIYVQGVGGGLTNNIRNPNFAGKPKEYEAVTTAPCLPGFDLVYKGKQWAVYLDFGMMQAAPGMTFKQGLSVIDWGIMAPIETLTAGAAIPYDGILRNPSARRTEYYLGTTVGASYKILDWLAAAIGVRYIYATGNQNISVTGNANILGGGSIPDSSPWLIDVDVKGHGVGLIFGLDFKPVDMINIGLKYEYYPNMELEKKTNKFIAPALVINSGSLNLFLDDISDLVLLQAAGYAIDITRMNPQTFKNIGKKLKVTYPQTLSMGFSVMPVKNLKLETSGELSFRGARDLGGRESNWSIGYRVGQSIEWTFVPQAAVSVGYLYNDFGIKKDKRDEVDPLLTSHTVGGGFKFMVVDWLDINLGAFNSFFKPEKTNPNEYTNVSSPTMHFIKKRFDEKRWSVAIGLTVRLFTKADESKTEEKAI